MDEVDEGLSHPVSDGYILQLVIYTGYRLRPFELKCVFTYRRGVHSGKGTYSE